MKEILVKHKIITIYSLVLLFGTLIFVPFWPEYFYGTLFGVSSLIMLYITTIYQVKSTTNKGIISNGKWFMLKIVIWSFAILVPLLAINWVISGFSNDLSVFNQPISIWMIICILITHPIVVILQSKYLY